MSRPVAFPFHTALELHNPGPVPFEVKPLLKATSPLLARKAADDGQVTVISDRECRSRIRSVAVQIYEYERAASIWHRNLCGQRAANNLLYNYICSVHGRGREIEGVSTKCALSSASEHLDDSSVSHGVSLHKSMAALPTCQFVGLSNRPCELPELDAQRTVNLAYFDCLFYVTVAKIRELHKELCDRLSHGLITPDAKLCQLACDVGASSHPSTVEEFLEALGHLWASLVDTEVIASLDTAIRFRSLGHWSIIMEKDTRDTAATKDSQDRRQSLLKKKPSAMLKNEQFLESAGLMDVFEDSMPGPMISMIVNDIHANAMREKEVFQIYVAQKIAAARRESDGPRSGAPSIEDPRVTVAEFPAQQDKPPRDSVHADFATDQGETLVGFSTRAHVAAEAMRCAQMATTRHRREPRQLYALNLYTTDRQPRTILTLSSTEAGGTPGLCDVNHATTESQVRDSQTQDENTTASEILSDWHFVDHSSPLPETTRRSQATLQKWQQDQRKQGLVDLSGATSSMQPPPAEGTWSYPKDQLYALLPEVPNYGATCTPKGRPRNVVSRGVAQLFRVGKRR